MMRIHVLVQKKYLQRLLCKAIHLLRSRRKALISTV